MGFSRQKFCSGLPFPSPGHLPDSGIEAGSPALQAESIVWATREILLFYLLWSNCCTCSCFPETENKPGILIDTKHYDSVGKESAYNAGDIGDTGLIPGSGTFLEGGNGNSLQYSCWKIPWTEEPGGLQSKGSQRVGHAWANTHKGNIRYGNWVFIERCTNWIDAFPDLSKQEWS